MQALNFQILPKQSCWANHLHSSSNFQRKSQAFNTREIHLLLY